MLLKVNEQIIGAWLSSITIQIEMKPTKIHIDRYKNKTKRWKLI